MPNNRGDSAAQARESTILVRIEPALRAMVRGVERKTGVTASTYVRGAIIRDLVARGLADQEFLLRLTSMSTRELTDILEKAS